jgi:hypothetical protein
MSSPIQLTLQTMTPIVDAAGRPSAWFVQYELQGVTGSAPLAKLTPGGANGALTFFNGKLVNIVPPT